MNNLVPLGHYNTLVSFEFHNIGHWPLWLSALPYNKSECLPHAGHCPGSWFYLGNCEPGLRSNDAQSNSLLAVVIGFLIDHYLKYQVSARTSSKQTYLCNLT